MGLSCGVVCVSLRLAVLIQYRSVTDTQTDTQTDRHIDRQTHRHTDTRRRHIPRLARRRAVKTVPGSDNIPYWIFKHCFVELTCVIASLVNTSGSAIAEGPRDALVSRNSATYKTSHSHLKTRVSGLSCGIICRRTDRRTDRHTTTACTALSIASRGKNRL